MESAAERAQIKQYQPVRGSHLELQTHFNSGQNREAFAGRISLHFQRTGGLGSRGADTYVEQRRYTKRLLKRVLESVQRQ